MFICLISVDVMSEESVGMSCEAGFDQRSDRFSGLAVFIAPG